MGSAAVDNVNHCISGPIALPTLVPLAVLHCRFLYLEKSESMALLSLYFASSQGVFLCHHYQLETSSSLPRTIRR